MKLIVGLGNPGVDYSDSRHNIGFMVVKSLSRIYKVALKKESGIAAFTAKAKFGREAVVLAIPLTYMNLSGNAVAALVKKYKIDLTDLLVICDDLDLEVGVIRIRPQGSSAGHRGVKSIIDSLESKEFARLRIGIGRPRPGADASDFVLSPFHRLEKKYINEAIESAGECCNVWVTQGITESMNIFNVRSK